MGCADYRLYCDGDSDGDGNDLMHGVLDKKSVLESDFPERFVFSLYVVMGCYFFLGPNLPRPPIKPPFTFSISSIVRARALISFCCFIFVQTSIPSGTAPTGDG